MVTAQLELHAYEQLVHRPVWYERHTTSIAEQSWHIEFAYTACALLCEEEASFGETARIPMEADVGQQGINGRFHPHDAFLLL